VPRSEDKGSTTECFKHNFKKSLKNLRNDKLKNGIKDVGDDNLALFYTFSSKVSEKPGFRNN
jgi:hypothetical protein